MEKYYIKKSIGSTVFDIVNYVFMFLFSFTIVYPFWNSFLISFAEQSEVMSMGFRFWIRNWNFVSYKFLLDTSNVHIAYRNTIFRTVVGTALTIVVSFMAAYALSKKNLPGRNFITIIYLIPMFFGGGLIPTYLLIRSLGLMNSIWVLIIPGAVSSFNVIIMRNFLMAMDKGLEESALIDGAGYFKILYKIIAPLSKPVIATVTLWSGVGHWNAWFDAMIYIRDDNKLVLQLLLRRLIAMTYLDMTRMMERMMQGEVIAHTASVVAAATMLTIGPIVMAYPFLQKYFVKGIMIGSLKG